jgi:tRNA (guanine26-N2/guanine27-N2)-dimethyltransferase
LQELAVRLLLQTLATTAARYGRIIKPRLSVGMDFYVRVFVTVHASKAGVQDLSLHIGKVFQSTQCQSFIVIPEGVMGGKKGTVYQASRAPGVCSETGAAYKMGGPIWLGPMHDVNLVQRALERLSEVSVAQSNLQYLATKDRLRGLLQSCAEELPDVPLFYRMPDMASLLKVTSPPRDDVYAALINAGYRVSGYHKDPQAVKTDAPSHVMWDILRAWSAKHPPSKPPAEGTAGARILQKPSQTTVDFTHPKSGIRPKRTDVARFPQNPQAGWGPRKKAKRSKDVGSIDS